MFKEIFIKLCIEKNEAPSMVCMKLGFSNATFSKWNENTIPRQTTLQKIADYFNVSVDYLLGKEEITKEDEQDKELAGLWAQLTPEQKRETYKYALYLIERDK